jgi:conjugative relaxase-like TrwC/TraI family protein
MVHASKALTASKAQSYFRKEYANSQNSYYTQGETLQGQWHGEFAKELKLSGAVDALAFDRLANGQNPETGEQWIAHRNTQRTQDHKELEHRAGLDLTFNAPKTVSLAALPGHDERVRIAHAESVRTALDAGQEYMQARMGGDKPSQTTGKWVAALFEHDTARPVDGYPAPHLHTHAVVFNMTRDAEGQVRSMQPQELYRVQSYMTAVYQNELAGRLKELGYELTAGTNHAPDIKGFSKEYLEAESQRSQRIKIETAERGLSGRKAEEKIAHSVRENKLDWSPEKVHEAHRLHQAEFGGQADKVRLESLERKGITLTPEDSARQAKESIDFAKNHLSERSSVHDQYELYREALWHRQGKTRLADLQKEVSLQESQGLLQKVEHVREHSPGARYATAESLRMERDLIQTVINGKETRKQLEHWTVADVQQKYPQLNAGQAQSLQEVMQSRDTFGSVHGYAGVGKTKFLQAVQPAFEAHGYEVRGLAATSGAVKEMQAVGIEAQTLQMHLTKPEQGLQPRYYIVDESSLASTRMLHELTKTLQPADRVLFVGDTKQHESIEAGRIYAQLREAGMAGTSLREIMRQQDPKLKEVVEDLSRGQVKTAVGKLADQGRIQEQPNKLLRYEAIAEAYVKGEGKTLIVSPDNASRKALNLKVREKLDLTGPSFEQGILVARQDLTKEQRKVAASYRVDDVVKFQRENKKLGIQKGELVSVLAVNAHNNTLTVKVGSRVQTYSPDKAHGVQLYERQTREFSQGERIQLTAPWKDKGLANRQTGTITSLDSKGNVAVRMDADDRKVRFNLKQMKHLDYGYAVTSFSSQGSTADRVLVNIDTGDSRINRLLNERFAYVAISRARHDAQVFTDNAKGLAETMSRKQDKEQALHPSEVAEYRKQAVEIRQHKQAQSVGMGMGY